MNTPNIRVAIQGNAASFHEIAAKKFYSTQIKVIYCTSFEDAFKLLNEGLVEYAFIAVSNTAHGEIYEVKNLLQSYSVIVDGTHKESIKQHLIGTSNAQIQNIKTVISHPVALSQCSVYIQKQLIDVKQVSYFDTSAAVEYVKALADKTTAAVASEAAAELHGLQIIKRDIHNDRNNSTTFVSLLKKDS